MYQARPPIFEELVFGLGLVKLRYSFRQSCTLCVQH